MQILAQHQSIPIHCNSGGSTTESGSNSSVITGAVIGGVLAGVFIITAIGAVVLTALVLCRKRGKKIDPV